ncbi:MAG: hypothetical protein MZV65_18665 [Chromatiales bacterium]|nr:hypothetical protein [Chromatiales bacterium]
MGRVDEARTDIDRALKLAPNDANALALQAVIAVTQGDKGQALDTARKAVAASPNSATAQLALSYAQQASFDLPGARASVERPVQVDPQNALAWARHGRARTRRSATSTRRSRRRRRPSALDPNLSRTQTVLGFAYLAQVETAAGAGGLRQGDRPRLRPIRCRGSGMGLASHPRRRPRGGRPARSRSPRASTPNNALVRSYLGKTYYEEKLRSACDEREYDVAKELDPNDPTP